MAEKNCTAKRKYKDEHKTFVTEWESLYFFVKCNTVRRGDFNQRGDFNHYEATSIRHNIRLSYLKIINFTQQVAVKKIAT